MLEDVEAKLTTRFSQRMLSIEEKVELMEVKTNKLLGLYNDLEEKMFEIDRKLAKLILQNKR